MDSVDKKRLDKLARVRENQRKSRARRQDHLRDLEEKVFGLQKELERKDIEHRLAIQKLEAENRRLREVLSSSGIPPDALEAHLRRVDNPVMTHKVAIPALQRPAPKTCSQSEQSQCARPCAPAPTSPATEELPSRSPERTGTTTAERTPAGPVIEFQTGKPDEPREPEIPSFCACPPGEGSESLPISERVLNTTFCAIAERLIDQYNSRGVDVSEIRQKLRQGFFRDTSEEGCRVQNQILFQVLDEISGH
ncbi:hypothetical protein BJX61DRAFT_382799 [Aspergillus egyptiacus]|nr:hypothetical protein BJX61DRAFT_382799 [Aspergillus egyptiacus]